MIMMTRGESGFLHMSFGAGKYPSGCVWSANERRYTQELRDRDPRSPLEDYPSRKPIFHPTTAQPLRNAFVNAFH